MIYFKKIRYKNFLSTGNYFTEILFDKSPNTLVVGSNGAGKSTMLDALCFALFGKAFRSVNKPQLLNSINQKDCVTECHFSVGLKQYKIVRGIKPNIFEIYCDDQLINQDAATRDYQEYLEKFILKLNYKSFTQIVILGSASFVPFMQLSDADRRAIIEDLLDIQIFSTMNNVVKNKLSANKEQITLNKSQYEIANTKYDMQQKHINQLKQNNKEKINEYLEEIRGNQITIQKISVESANTNVQIESLRALVSDKSSFETKLKKITKLESQIESNISKYKNDISFLQHNDNCPTCRQEIALAFKEQRIDEYAGKASECLSGLKLIEERIINEQANINNIVTIEKQIQQHEIKIATNDTTVSEIKKYIAKLDKEIESLGSVKDNLDDEDKKMMVLYDTLQELTKEKNLLLDEKVYLESAAVLLKDTGIKTKIIKQYLPVINKLVNKYLASFDFFVNFNLDESFKETIKSRHRDEFSYASFSEGEKQRIDMALMLTWRSIAKLKNSANTNLLILDEIFDSSLDNNGTEYLMSILHMLEDVNLFVISHKGDILQDKFRSLIRFEKVNNFSKVMI